MHASLVVFAHKTKYTEHSPFVMRSYTAALARDGRRRGRTLTQYGTTGKRRTYAISVVYSSADLEPKKSGLRVET